MHLPYWLGAQQLLAAVRSAQIETSGGAWQGWPLLVGFVLAGLALTAWLLNRQQEQTPEPSWRDDLLSFTQRKRRPTVPGPRIAYDDDEDEEDEDEEFVEPEPPPVQQRGIPRVPTIHPATFEMAKPKHDPALEDDLLRKLLSGE